MTDAEIDAEIELITGASQIDKGLMLRFVAYRL